jgi:hypothetical protein
MPARFGTVAALGFASRRVYYLSAAGTREVSLATPQRSRLGRPGMALQKDVQAGKR